MFARTFDSLISLYRDNNPRGFLSIHPFSAPQVGLPRAMYNLIENNRNTNPLQ